MIIYIYIYFFFLLYLMLMYFDVISYRYLQWIASNVSVFCVTSHSFRRKILLRFSMASFRIVSRSNVSSIPQERWSNAPSWRTPREFFVFQLEGFFWFLGRFWSWSAWFFWTNLSTMIKCWRFMWGWNFCLRPYQWVQIETARGTSENDKVWVSLFQMCHIPIHFPRSKFFFADTVRYVLRNWPSTKRHGRVAIFCSSMWPNSTQYPNWATVTFSLAAEILSIDRLCLSFNCRVKYMIFSTLKNS